MRQPFVQVIGQSGSDLVPGWGTALVSAEYTDNDGGEADEVSFTFAVSAPFPDSPAEGTKYHFLYGWADGDVRDAGLFTYQSNSLAGDTEGGWTMTITARASDFIDADKAADTEHFDDTTVGDILQKLASRAGKSAVVDASIASIKIPYRLRYNQSLTGFASELAEEFGGTLKFAGGKVLVPARSTARTAGGRSMPIVTIDYSEVLGGEISTEGKARYAEVGSGYFDPLEGVQKLAEAASIGSASRYLSLHPARSQAEAEHSAKAQGAEHARDSVTGSIDAVGDIDAMAGARVKLSGFGNSRDAADLVASSIHHSFTFHERGGWTMSIELGNRKTSRQSSAGD